VACRLVEVTKAPVSKALGCKVRDGWHQARQNSATDPCRQAISPGEVVSALGRMKLGTGPGCDLVHPELLKHLRPDLQNILRLSYDNAKVTIDLRRTSNLQNILRRAQGFLRYDSLAKL